MLSFVIVGGGPTGVEFAGSTPLQWRTNPLPAQDSYIRRSPLGATEGSGLVDMLNTDLKKAFPRLSSELATVTIVQSADHILNTYSASISEYTEQRYAIRAYKDTYN